MNTIETTCRTACNKLKKAWPYPYDLNIYRGCEHGCKYCFAIYSHDYVDGVRSGTFFKDIVVKTNIVEQLERQFAGPSWNGDVVNIGGVTDSYQPAEAHYKLMPEILKLFIRFKNPCIISTKSNLILRDFDLIDRLSRVAHVNIACTITAFDERIRKKLEPGGATSAERFDVLAKMAETKASRGVHIMPIVPYLTDGFDNLENIYAKAAEIDASYVLTSSLNLKGPTRGTFFEFIKGEYPEIFDDIVSLWSGESAKGRRAEYKKEMYRKIRVLQERYGLRDNWQDFAGERRKNENDNGEQLTISGM